MISLLSAVFLYTAHIRGVEVIAKETFTITQEAVKLNFEGYGFKLCVPKNSLPAEVSETQLSVQVIVCLVRFRCLPTVNLPVQSTGSPVPISS